MACGQVADLLTIRFVWQWDGSFQPELAMNLNEPLLKFIKYAHIKLLELQMSIEYWF